MSDFDDLPEYSLSLPTWQENGKGEFIGCKRWKRRTLEGWMIGEARIEDGEIKVTWSRPRGVTVLAREESDTTESLRAKMEAAHRMVVALCKPKGDPDRRSWSMSIPALPDYDPDLVIGAGLRAGLDALARLEMAEQERREFLVMLDFAYHLRFVDDSNSQEEQYSFWGKVEDAIAELAALAREETTSPSARLAM